MHKTADVHPAQCRYCGGQEFWHLSGGPRISFLVDIKTREHSTELDFYATVRCKKCHATFNAVWGVGADRSALDWKIGRAW